jgi:hypothetical protein
MTRTAALACVLFLMTPINAAQSATFAVIYDESRDQACGAARGYAIKDGWVRELKAILPPFQELWKNKAPALFDAAAALTRRQTEPFVAPVTLTLCDTPSQSFSGPSVNMRFALRSFTAQPVPLRYKADTAFHESLHAFTSRHVPRESKLLAQHRSESACVLNHLHLLALQKAVLLAVGDAVALEQVVAIDSLLPSGCYKRAWSLVNETSDAYKTYVAELAE